MAGRDRTVIVVRVPSELRVITEWYQRDRKLPSLNQAVIELLETHPAIASIVTGLYSECDQSADERTLSR
jgi:hypothetical protein